MPDGFWGSWANLTWSSCTCSHVTVPSELGTRGGVFLHSFPYKCLCLERHDLVALWISRHACSAWLPVQPPWCLGMSLPGHRCQLSPKPHPEGGRYSGPAWGGGFQLPTTPKIIHGCEASFSQGTELKCLCSVLARALTNLALLQDAPLLGRSVWLGKCVCLKCSQDLEAPLLEGTASVFTLRERMS